MIRLLGAGGEAEFLALCDSDYVLGAEIRTRRAVFGADAERADFWLATAADGAPCAAICRENGRMAISANSKADVAELGGFLRMVGGYGELCAEAGLCEQLLPSLPLESAPAMQYPGGLSCRDHTQITEAIPLDDLYGLLDCCFDDFGSERERWYTYASHLFRHGLGFAAGIYRRGSLAATGGVYAFGARHGVIASVATAPELRGEGLAEAIVHYLCDRLLKLGKTPVLLCAEEGLRRYYEGLGFHVFGRWGRKSLDNAPQGRLFAT